MHSAELVTAEEIAQRYRRELPADLWSVGSLEGLARPVVAIVGTRAATPYGRGLARRFARDLGMAGCCIVSGLALGIDAEGHLGALEAGAPTIGILGGGHGHFFPKRNAALAERIVDAGGAVCSPFAPDVVPKPSYFLARNGFVAALSDAVVVVEAPERSGALNTARWAAERALVFAVPGDVDRPHSAGCLTLLRDGATLARNADDILEALQIVRPAQAVRQKPRLTSVLDPLAAALLAALGSGERTLDDLMVFATAPPGAVLAALSALEASGHIEVRGTDRYAVGPDLLC